MHSRYTSLRLMSRFPFRTLFPTSPLHIHHPVLRTLQESIRRHWPHGHRGETLRVHRRACRFRTRTEVQGVASGTPTQRTHVSSRRMAMVGHFPMTRFRSFPARALPHPARLWRRTALLVSRGPRDLHIIQVRALRRPSIILRGTITARTIWKKTFLCSSRALLAIQTSLSKHRGLPLSLSPIFAEVSNLFLRTLSWNQRLHRNLQQEQRLLLHHRIALVLALILPLLLLFTVTASFSKT